MKIHYIETEYGGHQAIQVSWSGMEAAGFNGDGSDDEEIVSAIIAIGGPKWAKDAEGWIDKYGWGLIGPEK